MPKETDTQHSTQGFAEKMDHLQKDVFKFLGSSGQHEKSSSAAHLLIYPYKAAQHLTLIFPVEGLWPVSLSA